MKMKALALLCAAAAAVLFAPLHIRAATYTWSGAGFMGQDFLWSNPFNWVGLSAPQTGETNIIIVLPNNGAPRTTTNDIAGLVIKSVRFQGDNYIVAGKSPGNSITLTLDRFTGDTIEATGDNGQFASTVSLVLTSSITADVAATKTFHVRATMSGPGGFTKSGVGTLHFNSPGNSYQGDTFVSDGILDLQTGLFGPTVAIPGDLTIGSTNFLFSPVVHLLSDDQIADSATVTVNANAKLWLNTHDDTFGPLVLVGGLVNTGLGGGGSSPGVLTLNGNITNRYSGVNNFSTVSGLLNLGVISRVIDVGTNSELGITANIGGSPVFPPGITKTGPGLLTLYNATNTYGGSTIISDGTLQVIGTNQLLGNTNSGTTIGANGQLHLVDFHVGQESLTIAGGTNIALLYEGSNSWAGPVTLNGEARIYGDAPGGNPYEMVFSGVISGAGALTKLGGGTLRLTGSGANTFSGGLNAVRGFVKLLKSSSASAFNGPLLCGESNVFAVGCIVSVEANNQIPNGVPIRIFPSAALEAENGAIDTLGPIEMTSGLLISVDGTFTLSSSVTNHASPESAGLYGAISVTTDTHVFHCDAGSTLRGVGSLNGLMVLSKTGRGTMTLENTNTYMGETVIKDGFLRCVGKGRLGLGGDNTEVYSNAVLILDNANHTNETLVLNGHPVNYSVYVRGQCRWAGNISLEGDAGVQFENANGLTNQFIVDGTISGSSGLRSDGDGELIFTGSTDNTFGGLLWVRSSDARFQKIGGAAAVNSQLKVGLDVYTTNLATLTYSNSHQVGNSVPMTLLQSANVRLGSFNDTVGPLTFAGGDFDYFSGLLTLNGNVTVLSNNSASFVGGNISLGGATRTFDLQVGGNLDLGGDVQDGGGSAGIIKTGEGNLSLSRKTSYTGDTLIQNGGLRLQDNGTPGNSAGDTEIAAGARLFLYNSHVTNETLRMTGIPNAYTVDIEGTNNVWKGSIEISGTVRIETSFSGLQTPWLIDGQIFGTGALRYFGDGELTLAGNSTNTYTGATTVEQGILVLNKVNATAIPRDLIIGNTNGLGTALVRCEQNDQFESPFGAALLTRRVTVNPNGNFDLNDFHQTIANLTLRDGFVDSGTSYLGLLGDMLVETFGGQSFMLGKLQVGVGASPKHFIDVKTNAVLWCAAGVGEFGSSISLQKNGEGSMLLLSSNSFTGDFIISNGTVYASGPNAFGTTNGMTRVGVGASLSIAVGTCTEPFELAGNGYQNGCALTVVNTNTLTGPMTLNADATVNTPSNTLLNVAGSIGGPGGLMKKAPGVLQFTGTNANTYAGTTLVREGRFDLAKTNALAVAGVLTVGTNGGLAGSAITRWFQPNQVSDASVVMVESSGQLELQNNNETVGSLAGSGNVLLGSAALTTGGDGSSTSFAGFISGIGGQLIKTGAGTMTLNGNNNYTGGSTVNGGVLLVNGQQPQSPVSLLTGGQVGGNGRVGNISALNGHVAPGTSPGKLTSGNLSFFSPSSLLKIEIGGTNAGVTYDQVDVNGSVLLMGGALQLAMNFAGAVSNQYVIVKNDGADPVSGTFAGVTNGASVTNNGTIFVVKYNGGDGNDIVLIQQNVSVGPQIGSIQPAGPGRMQINGVGIPNMLYSVQATTNLNSPIMWSVIGSTMSDGMGLMSYLDNDAANYAMRFYRFALP